MKYLVKKVVWQLPIAVAAMMFIFVSCDKDTEKRVIPDWDPGKPVVVTSFFPDSGRVREHILIEGSNFGGDVSLIKVFFDDFEAKVVGANGTSILTLVPRVAGALPDVNNLCKLSVQVGSAEKKTFPKDFRYRVSASVTTFAGNGENVNDFAHGLLDKVRFAPVFIGVDSKFNIFVTTTNSYLLLLNEKDNAVVVLMNSDQGMNQHNQPNVNPDDVIMMGHHTLKERFTLLDPKDAWAPKPMLIKAWDVNGYTIPSSSTHHYLLWCTADNQFYTRYNSGEIVRIDPTTWRAKVVGKTPSGNTYSGAFNPENPSELWMGYDFNTSEGDMRNSLCRVNVLDDLDPDTGEPVKAKTWEAKKLEEDPDYDEEINPPPYGKDILWTFEKMSGAIGGDHRDGPLHEAQFNGIRQLNFDQEAGVLYLGDSRNYCIRMVNFLKEGMPVSTLIGIPKSAGNNDGNREDARFREIHGIVADADGVVYASDWNNYKIRRIAVE